MPIRSLGHLKNLGDNAHKNTRKTTLSKVKEELFGRKKKSTEKENQPPQTQKAGLFTCQHVYSGLITRIYQKRGPRKAAVLQNVDTQAGHVANETRVASSIDASDIVSKNNTVTYPSSLPPMGIC